MPVKNIIPGQRVTKEKLQRAKELRREMTPAEKILWEELRANKLGVHFRRHTCPGGRCQGQVIAGLRCRFLLSQVRVGGGGGWRYPRSTTGGRCQAGEGFA